MLNWRLKLNVSKMSKLHNLNVRKIFRTTNVSFRFADSFSLPLLFSFGCNIRIVHTNFWCKCLSGHSVIQNAWFNLHQILCMWARVGVCGRMPGRKPKVWFQWWVKTTLNFISLMRTEVEEIFSWLLIFYLCLYVLSFNCSRFQLSVARAYDIRWYLIHAGVCLHGISADAQSDA